MGGWVGGWVGAGAVGGDAMVLCPVDEVGELTLRSLNSSMLPHYALPA